jgi:hypothetical protein
LVQDETEIKVNAVKMLLQKPDFLKKTLGTQLFKMNQRLKPMAGKDYASLEREC